MRHFVCVCHYLLNHTPKNQNKNSKLRYLVRMSGTEPILRILIEGKDKQNVIKAGKNIRN